LKKINRTNRLVMSRKHFEAAKRHMIVGAQEGFAFLLCGTAQSAEGIDFLVRDIILVKDTDLEYGSLGLQVKLECILKVTNQARKEKLSVVEAHSHPWTKANVRFSQTDLQGLKEFVPYILDDLPGMPYAAMVWGENCADGLCWRSSPDAAEFLTEVRIVGDCLTRIRTTSSLRKTRAKSEPVLCEKTARQVLAIGETGQEEIGKTNVAIVGLGGLGSHCAQLLAYLGVRNFVLVDFDSVESENLNRLVGAGPKDLNKPKIDVAEKIIRHVAKGEKLIIRKFQSDLRALKTLDALKHVDFIFGCVDKNGPRLVLNELAVAHMIPYIDCAFGIEVENGAVKEAGGRVVFVKPDGPCLLCCKEIDTKAASDDLASSEEVENRRRQGYVSGVDVLSPSVVSLDGTIASVGVTEFLCFVTGLRPAQTYTSYDMMEQRLVSRIVKPDPKCVTCSVKGFGDRTRIERYGLI
jgi:molybdopterin/thiamine biosynthesis adenylyltransferase